MYLGGGYGGFSGLGYGPFTFLGLGNWLLLFWDLGNWDFPGTGISAFQFPGIGNLHFEFSGILGIGSFWDRDLAIIVSRDWDLWFFSVNLGIRLCSSKKNLATQDGGRFAILSKKNPPKKTPENEPVTIS